MTQPTRGRSRTVDRTGQRFSRLVAVRPAKPGPQGARWLCRCDCGNEVTATAADLVRGHTRSCGCLKSKPRNGHKPGEAEFKYIFRMYQDNARNRGVSWEVAEDEFRHLATQDCHYCGAPPQTAVNRSRYGGVWVYNGLDRVDNARGYTLDNVVPCCKRCNHAKKDMSLDEFMAWIARLTEYHWFHPEIMPSRLINAARRGTAAAP